MIGDVHVDNIVKLWQRGNGWDAECPEQGVQNINLHHTGTFGTPHGRINERQYDLIDSGKNTAAPASKTRYIELRDSTTCEV